MGNKHKQIILLAKKLYFDLPWWKKSRASKFYKSNNWDVTDVWKDCLHQASIMIEEAESYVN